MHVYPAQGSGLGPYNRTEEKAHVEGRAWKALLAGEPRAHFSIPEGKRHFQARSKDLLDELRRKDTPPPGPLPRASVSAGSEEEKTQWGPP